VTSGVSDQTDVVALEATGERSYAWDEGERRLDCREEEHEIFVPPATGGSERRDLTQEVCLADLSITAGTDRDWCDDVGTEETVETCADQVEEAVAAADLAVSSVDEIELTEQHQSPITTLGVGPSYVMPMTNRATYYHFHVGSDASEHHATLPPGAGGNINLAEFGVLTATGDTPEHVDDQIPDYVDFEPKEVPFDRAKAEADAESTATLLVPPSP
jgi:hypothetical protein